MKKLIMASMMLFSVGMFATSNATPDWLIFVGANGHWEIYDDGCNNGLTIVVESTGDVFNSATGPC